MRINKTSKLNKKMNYSLSIFQKIIYLLIQKGEEY